MMVSINPTLVETVSINYEDFSESFLTCGTCLCVYNGVDHIPKLLPCSHTVCLDCLNRIADVRSREIGVFRCPICRELTNIPQGGISALPPSFLVNRLLDLMSRQRRHIIPTCSDHSNQILYTCETCDVIFCILCQNGASHKPINEESKNCEHTIVPYSVAIKRMAEILIYKANECLSKLTNARDTVNAELEKLDRTGEECIQTLNKAFQEIHAAVDQRKNELITKVQETKECKKAILNEQLSLITDEKEKVEKICDGLEYQTDTHAISQKISSLSENIDSIRILEEPRENSYICCNMDHEKKFQKMMELISGLGRIVSTTSLPRLCMLHMEDNYVVNLAATAVVKTVDYHGKPRVTGSDPITVQLHKKEATESIPVPVTVEDRDDGTYVIKFRPKSIGCYVLEIFILGRYINDGIRTFMVSKHNNPISIHGTSRGDGSEEYLQPAAVAVDHHKNLVYVVDTGNSRIKVLTSNLEFIRHIENPCMKGRACTGIGVYSQEGNKDENDWIAAVNWRSKFITRMTVNGETLNEFTHNSLQEPTHLAVDSKKNRIIVADGVSSSILVFNIIGELLLKFTRPSSPRKTPMTHISCVCVGLNSEIIIADSRIQIFSIDGLPQKEIHPENDGHYGGISMDGNGILVATRSEKARHFIQVVNAKEGVVVNTIDSYNSRLCRPSGVACTKDNHVLVVDLGNDSIKKYRYW